MKRRAATLLGLSLLAGCGGTPTTEVFTLTRKPAATVAPSGRPVLIHVDRAAVAGYFDRPQMVSRREDFRVSFHEFAVWSEPVADLITRALVDDLAQRFGTDQVMTTPSPRLAVPNWRVEVDVLRFDVDDAGAAVLDARWRLLAGATDRQVANRRERIETAAAKPAEAASRVAALREALAGLAERIGGAIATARP